MLILCLVIAVSDAVESHTTSFSTIKQPKIDLSSLPAVSIHRHYSLDDTPSASAEGGHGGRRTNPTSPSQRRNFRIAHGTIMGLSFVIILPIGGVVLRLPVPQNKRPVRAHATIQLTGYASILVGLGLGLWLGLNVRFLDYAHTIIGMSVIAALLVQAVLGGLNHALHKKHGRGTLWGVGHVWFGRTLLMLGIANGGVGLLIADNTSGGRIVYGVLAGASAAIYLGVLSFHLMRKSEVAGNRIRIWEGR